MKTDRIEFISNYCDRWCERCAYTARCATYACEMAVQICEGDHEEAMELALGTPDPEPGEAEENDGEWDDEVELEEVELSPEEETKLQREAVAHHQRIRELPLNRKARAYTMQAHQWLEANYDRLHKAVDPVLAEALAIVSHDCMFIAAKLHRALDGRERQRCGEDDDNHPVQNDWNGSAKVALISIERSEMAWRVIAQASRDRRAVQLSDAAHELRHLVLKEFPRAMDFIRPGFDEPWR